LAWPAPAHLITGVIRCICHRTHMSCSGFPLSMDISSFRQGIQFIAMTRQLIFIRKY